MAPATHYDEDGDLGFQIAPMVDVVFVLMLFFMVTAAFQAAESPLKASLASADPSRRTFVTPITIVVAADGSVLVQDQPIASSGEDCARLREWLKSTRIGFGAQDPVVLQPAPSVRHERVMQVLAAAKAAGCNTVSFR